MLYLQKPMAKDEKKYKEMIKEWQEYGGPYVPCIIDYDCNCPIEKLNYNATIEFVENYSKGKLCDDDVDYFERANFYFIFDDEELIGMGEVRHNLKPLGENSIGHIACGIRPSKRKQGYALQAVELMLEKLKEDNIEKAIICHYKENEVTPKIAESLGFTHSGNVTSTVTGKEICLHSKKYNINKEK